MDNVIRLGSSSAAVPASPWLGRWLIYGTVFIVVAGNAIILIWSGLLPVLFFMPLAALLRVGISPSSLIVDRRALPWIVAMSSLALLGFGSFVANGGDSLNLVTWLSSYVSPIILYLAIRQYCDDPAFMRRLALVVLLAASMPLLFGLVQYYREWGIPTGVELLLSRYDLVRMDGYMTATFGNTSSTTSYLALVVPFAVSMCFMRAWEPWMRWCAFAVTMIALANVVIVQSRALLWVLLLGMPAILWFYRVRVAGVIMIVAVAVGIFVLPFLAALDELVAHTTSVLGGSQADNSVSERVEAMKYALYTLADNPGLGVGPGNTITVNPHTSAHQFWLQQGSELGVGGLIGAFALTVIVVLRFLGILWRRAGRVYDEFSLACFGGAACFVAYGVLANVALANTFVNAWAGLFAVLVALGEASDTLGRETGTGNVKNRNTSAEEANDASDNN